MAGCTTPRLSQGNLQEQADSWRVGKPVPTDLLSNRVPHGSAGWYGPDHSLRVFDVTKDYPLVLTIVLDPRTDDAVFEYALVRSLILAGPNQFYADIEKGHKRQMALLSESRQAKLQALSQETHVVVDSLFIKDSDMPDDEAKTVLDQISKELETNSWSKVYGTYCNEYFHYLDPSARQGERDNGRRSKIGNFGSYIISPSNRSAMPFRNVSIPEEHASRLLTGKLNDVVIEKDNDAHAWRLYKISEVYEPKKIDARPKQDRGESERETNPKGLKDAPSSPVYW